jgi:zeta-carotene desaturase
MGEWLRQHAQTKRAVDRFWRPVLISAVNEELDNMAASHGFQVFRLGFLGSRADSLMGVPAVPLADLYDQRRWSRWTNVEIRLRTPVESIETSGEIATRAITAGRDWRADFFVSALPFERVTPLIPWLDLRLDGWEHSPITGIHLWFDRPVTTLPHAALLDRTIQWFFNKSGGTYLEVVVSASRALLDMPRGDVIALAVRELGEFLPAIREASLVKAHVVKEARATFSARPGLDAQRPGPRTKVPNLFLAGDWTRTGWPATMEGAVRSGYLAAEAVAASAGTARRFLIPDPI